MAERNGSLRVLVATSLAILFASVVWLTWPDGDATTVPPAASIDVTPSDSLARAGDVTVPPVHGPPAQAVDSAREAVDASASAPPSDTQTDVAWLDVLVLRADTGVPVVGIEIGAGILDQTGIPYKPEAWVLTDEGGRALLEVPVEWSLYLQANEAWSRVRGAEEVAALKAGERRSVEFQLHFASRRVFHGRVVTAGDGTPIAEARIVRESPWGEDRTSALADERIVGETDSQGRFHFDANSTVPTTLEVHAPGYAVRPFETLDGHESIEQERELRLVRSATLRVSIPDAMGQPLEVTLTASFMGSSGEEADLWRYMGPIESRRTIGTDGRVVFEGLSPRTPHSMELRRGEELLRNSGRPIVLQPGETRDITWSLAGVPLSGRVLHADHSPVSDTKVWLLHRETAEPLRLEPEMHGEQAVAPVSTDESGSFRFEAIAPGDYWVGPLSGDASSGRGPDLTFAVPVRVEQHPQEVLIVVPETFLVRGVVLGADDEPLEHIYVHASSSDVYGGPTATSDAEGRFELGPLPVREFTVGAFSSGSWMVHDPISVRPGSPDLVLRMEACSALSGRVLDARTDEAVSGDYVVSRKDDPLSVSMSGHDGAFETLVAPGAYAVVATASGDRIGVSFPHVVEAGIPTDDVVVRVAPGGLIHFLYEGDVPLAHYEVSWNGYGVDFNALRSGTETWILVPPGEIEIKLHTGLHVTTRRVTVAAGDEVDIEFGH